MDSITFLTSLQHHLAPAEDILRWLSLHTYSSYYLLIAITVYWSGFATIGARLGCSVLFSTLIFGSCRQFFASPRPYWDHPHLFKGLYEKAWGMPSGHTQNAVVFWGLSAFSLKIKLFSVFCLLTAASIAISRLYLGLHFPDQVLAGLIIGSVLLLLWKALETRTLNQLNSCHLPVQLILVFLFSGLPLLITSILREVAGSGSGNAEILPYKRLIFYSGLLQGAGVSLILAFRCKNIISNSFSTGLLSTRALPGLVLVCLFWKFKYVQPGFIQHEAILYFWFWLEGIALSFWACLLWPALHSKLCKTKIMQK